MTLRFIHFGDTHLSRTYPAPIAHERVKAFNKAFSYVIDKAIEMEVDFIIHTGDLFDKISPWPTVVGFVKEKMVELHDHNIPIFIIRGNHDGGFDVEGIARGCSIELIQHPSMPYVYFIDPLYDIASSSKSVGYRDFDDIRVIGLGYYGHRGSEYFNRFIPQLISEDKVNILLLHTFVRGYTFSPPGEPSIGLEELKRLPVTYVAIGHDHEPREPLRLGEGRYVACSGSTEKWDFNEGDLKIFYLVEIDQDKVKKIKSFKIPREHEMKTLVLESDSPHPPEWYVEEAIRLLVREVTRSKRKLILRMKIRGRLSRGLPSDMPLSKIEDVARRLKNEGRLLYFDISPPDMLLDITKVISKLDTSTIDVKELLVKILNDEPLAQKAYELFDFTRALFRDEDNLTRDGNLKEQSLRLIKSRIMKLWDIKGASVLEF
ncbi:MAG: hypothetical protein DRN15_00180 [Thermoprotei archaeon]|nr:MAG: hypothetical protein DRN15_00180 [Thermoprotei archaeon]RLF25749.1 MAG: hypothetical protein DRM97_00820 [Thermoprotei archaeon]